MGGRREEGGKGEDGDKDEGARGRIGKEIYGFGRIREGRRTKKQQRKGRLKQERNGEETF